MFVFVQLEMPKKNLQKDENKQLEKMRKDLQSALEQSQNDIRHLKVILEEKTEELSEVGRERQEWTAAYIDVLNRLTVTQAALKENIKKNQDLEKKHQQVCEKQQLEEKQEHFRSKLSGEIKKLQKQLSHRMEAYEKDLSAGEAAFQRRLKEMLNCYEAQAKEWAKEERVVKDMILSKEEEIKELQVRWFFLTNV